MSKDAVIVFLIQNIYSFFYFKKQMNKTSEPTMCLGRDRKALGVTKQLCTEKEKEPHQNPRETRKTNIWNCCCIDFQTEKFQKVLGFLLILMSFEMSTSMELTF